MRSDSCRAAAAAVCSHPVVLAAQICLRQLCKIMLQTRVDLCTLWNRWKKIARATSNSNETGPQPRPSASGEGKLHRLLSQRKLSQIPTSKGGGERRDGTLPTAKTPEGVG